MEKHPPKLTVIITILIGMQCIQGQHPNVFFNEPIAIRSFTKNKYRFITVETIDTVDKDQIISNIRTIEFKNDTCAIISDGEHIKYTYHYDLCGNLNQYKYLNETIHFFYEYENCKILSISDSKNRYWSHLPNRNLLEKFTYDKNDQLILTESFNPDFVQTSQYNTQYLYQDTLLISTKAYNFYNNAAHDSTFEYYYYSKNLDSIITVAYLSLDYLEPKRDTVERRVTRFHPNYPGKIIYKDAGFDIWIYEYNSIGQQIFYESKLWGKYWYYYDVLGDLRTIVSQRPNDSKKIYCLVRYN